MTVTFLQLVDRARESLGGGNQGSCEWKRSVVEGWVKFGIKDYSMRFPRGKVTSIVCTSNVRQYDLPSDFIYIRSVEFPLSEDPPDYLVQKNLCRPRLLG